LRFFRGAILLLGQFDKHACINQQLDDLVAVVLHITLNSLDVLHLLLSKIRFELE
jgi:hypothetical protein